MLKKKRPLRERIAIFDEKGKESIVKQYAWYMDAAGYLNGRTIKSKQVALIHQFFTVSRISALGKGKISGTIDLT